MEEYFILEQIGMGAYGQVFKAAAASSKTTDKRPEKKEELRALKKIRMDGERDGFPVTAARELKLLQQMNHPNVLRLHGIQRTVMHTPQPDRDEDKGQKGFYVIYPWYENDLAGIISYAHKQLRTCLPLDLIREILRQFLEGLVYLHNNDIVHRDLKPSNLLVSSQGHLCIADFGLARQLPYSHSSLSFSNSSSLEEEKNRFHLTNRIATLWYRAPELLLGASHYGPEVDMWSVGCIAAELILGEPLFVSPTGSELSQVDEIVVFAEAHQSPLSLQKLLGKYPWAQAFSDCRCKHKPAKIPKSGNTDFDQLVLSCLQVDPQARITAQQALQHRFFTAVPKVSFPLKWEHDGRVISLIGMHDYIVNKKNVPGC